MQPILREKIPRRNDKCPCKSGRKAKVCCLKAIKWLRDLSPEMREWVVANRFTGRPNRLPSPVPAAVTEACAAVSSGVPA